jgi:hypothetical protein
MSLCFFGRDLQKTNLKFEKIYNRENEIVTLIHFQSKPKQMTRITQPTIKYN